jgi:RNA polymerase sigma factor (sigma-70 family)
MATGQDNSVIRHLRRAALLRDAGDMTDGQLLERFLAAQEEAAFEVLVRRHGPMVLGVCRRLLSNAHDAEDAFQAAFMVLIRKGPSLLPRQTLGNWLYGVAYHVALKARAAGWKRRAKERRAAAMSKPEASIEDTALDLLPLLDRELDRLPDRYREAVVLCDLEGKTRKEAARQLAIAAGTLSGRLTTARRMLAKRLTRRGVTLSVAALAAVLTPGTTSAGVSPALLGATVTSAAALAAGTGALSPQVAALTHGMMRSLLLAKLKLATAVLLTLALLSGGVPAYRLAAAKTPGPPDVPDAVAPVAEVPPQRPRDAVPKPTDKERLQGAWVPVKAIVSGRPTDPGDKKIRRSALAFDGDNAAVWDAKGSYTLDPDQNPRQLDIVLAIKDRKEVLQAIYEFDGDRLLVSWISGGDRPPSFAIGKIFGVLIVYEKKNP